MSPVPIRYTSDQISALKEMLDKATDLYNNTTFIPDDPISIPHRYSKLQDVEIAGFWTAILSWGNRTTILNKASELMSLMDNSPYDFVLHHKPADRKRFSAFKHRTFQYADTLYFLEFFQHFYQQHHSLESAFSEGIGKDDMHIGRGIARFHHQFFSLDSVLRRTRKHIATPERGSTCKRINMFLRWMVRTDDRGVDFGLWKKIKPSQLLIPLDVHVERIATEFGLKQRKQTDWKAVLEITEMLRILDPDDPVKYDYALFGLGLEARKRNNA